MDYEALLDGLVNQLGLYGAVHRKSIQPFKRDRISKQFPDFSQDFEHEVIRESLLEHVGCLPIIATYLHPHMDQAVDLGKSLTMIAIHDIGELIVGDELVFLKSTERGTAEFDAAMTLLHKNYKDLYRELNDLNSNEARFATSIDKMAPDIFDYLCGEDYSIRRIGVQVGWPAETAMHKVRARKRPYMTWSTTLTAFHDTLFSRFETVRQKEV